MERDIMKRGKGAGGGGVLGHWGAPLTNAA